MSLALLYRGPQLPQSQPKPLSHSCSDGECCCLPASSSRMERLTVSTWGFSANGRLLQISNYCSPRTFSRRRILPSGKFAEQVISPENARRVKNSKLSKALAQSMLVLPPSYTLKKKVEKTSKKDIARPHKRLTILASNKIIPKRTNWQMLLPFRKLIKYIFR